MTKKRRKKVEKDISNRVFLIIMTVALVLLLAAWIIKDRNVSNPAPETTVTEEADYSKFTSITVPEALSIASKDNLAFIYLGYEGCTACDNFVPTLIKAMNSYDVKIYFINTKKVDRESKDWKNFTKLLTKKVTLNIKENGEGKEYTKTIGAFLDEKGYTPTFVVLKNNKIIDGNIGGVSLNDLKEFLNNAGFSEK